MIRDAHFFFFFFPLRILFVYDWGILGLVL